MLEALKKQVEANTAAPAPAAAPKAEEAKKKKNKSAAAAAAPPSATTSAAKLVSAAKRCTKQVYDDAPNVSTTTNKELVKKLRQHVLLVAEKAIPIFAPWRNIEQDKCDLILAKMSLANKSFLLKRWNKIAEGLAEKSPELAREAVGHEHVVQIVADVKKFMDIQKNQRMLLNAIAVALSKKKKNKKKNGKNGKNGKKPFESSFSSDCSDSSSSDCSEMSDLFESDSSSCWIRIRIRLLFWIRIRLFFWIRFCFFWIRL